MEEEIGDGANDLPTGSIGPTPCADLFSTTRKVTIYGGSNEIQRNIIAKMVLGI